MCRQITQIEENEMCFPTCVLVIRAQLLDIVLVEIQRNFCKVFEADVATKLRRKKAEGLPFG